MYDEDILRENEWSVPKWTEATLLKVAAEEPVDAPKLFAFTLTLKAKLHSY